MRAAVINVSAPHYNLGAEKLANWLGGQGWEVERLDRDPGLFLDCDLVCLSVIFSWDAPLARDIANRLTGKAEVWAGGPGLFKLQPWWFAQTGMNCTLGLDSRFERQPGQYRMTFASRGCPVNCWFCIVPKMEGTKFTLYWDFEPAPILCDNNLSALPVDFQEHIIARFQSSGVRLLDANSGFEPATFDEGTYRRWKPILKGPWRFAFDYMPEWGNVERMMHLLRDEARKKKRVYVLIGNEPMETCYERAMKVIEWGGEPYCQPVLPLDALDRRAFILRYDWTEQRLVHFTRYFNRFLWKYTKLTDYVCGTLQPFREAAFAGTS